VLCLVGGAYVRTSAQAQAVTALWLIQNTDGGEWSVQEGSQKARAMDKFEVLTRTDRIVCRKAPCTLLYSTEAGGTNPFPPPPFKALRVGESFAIPAPPAQADPPAGRWASDFQEIIASVGVRGGRRKDSPTCFGELALVAPSCGEMLDAEDFTVRWVPSAEAGKTLTLMVGGADSSERRRWNVPTADGMFKSRVLDDYLVSLELPDRPTDVTIRLMRTESLSATRLVRLPSRADDVEFRKKLKSAALLSELHRNLSVLEALLRMRMWSRAAEMSEQLLRDAPHSIEIKKYALIGLCHSDLADRIAQLRSSLKDAGVTGLCDAAGAEP